MFVAAVRQPVPLALRGQSLYPEAVGVNFPNAGQGESSFTCRSFEPQTLPRRCGKEQFIVLASGQREIDGVELSSSGIGAAGRR